MINPTDVTIIVPHFGQTKEQCYSLNQCLISLRETVPAIRVVVIKNGPACTCYRDMRILQQGQCKAVNAGVAITNTPWVFITNDDMIYPPGWFENLCISVHMSEGCISPQLVEPRPGAPTFRTFFCGGAGGDFDKPKFLDYVKKVNEVEDLMDRPGFNFPLLIRRDIWDLVGGYDINYDPWGSNSDSDLQYKIMLAGIVPVQNTGSLVYHFSQTSGTFEPKNSDAWGKNWQYFIDKWGFPRTDAGIWEGNFEIPGLPVRKFNPEWEGKYK